LAASLNLSEQVIARVVRDQRRYLKSLQWQVRRQARYPAEHVADDSIGELDEAPHNNDPQLSSRLHATLMGAWLARRRPRPE
jgi:hypothetical protein